MSKEAALIITGISFLLNLIALMMFSYLGTQFPPVDPAPAGNFLEWLASPFAEGRAAFASAIEGIKGTLLVLTMMSLIPIVTLLGKKYETGCLNQSVRSWCTAFIYVCDHQFYFAVQCRNRNDAG